MSDIKSPKVTVELTGGFANQLFQWAAGYIVASESGASLVLDARLVDRPDARGLQLMGIVPEVEVVHAGVREEAVWSVLYPRLPAKLLGSIKRVRRRLYQPITRRARSYAAARRALQRRSTGIRLVGLFQETDQLVPERSKIISAIMRPPAYDGQKRGYAAVHVRRGDYVANKKYSRVFGVCSEEYYLDAINRIPTSVPVIVATDDRRWVADVLERVARENAEIAMGENHFDDFFMLVDAEQLVLSNSTFSWWAAFLSDARKVYAPTPWFTDRTREKGLILEEWTLLPREGKMHDAASST